MMRYKISQVWSPTIEAIAAHYPPLNELDCPYSLVLFPPYFLPDPPVEIEELLMFSDTQTEVLMKCRQGDRVLYSMGRVSAIECEGKPLFPVQEVKEGDR